MRDTTSILYGSEDTPASEHVTVPKWIDPDITLGTIAAVYEGGCESGAYMPAVTCHQAAKTMAEYGDDVLQFIEDCACDDSELPPTLKGRHEYHPSVR